MMGIKRSEFLSLSARRAWIEILKQLLLKTLKASLSARRAWIEIWCILCLYEGGVVALRKESVDRNADGTVSGSGDYGRSPQGERG